VNVSSLDQSRHTSPTKRCFFSQLLISEELENKVKCLIIIEYLKTLIIFSPYHMTHMTIHRRDIGLYHESASENASP